MMAADLIVPEISTRRGGAGCFPQVVLGWLSEDLPKAGSVLTGAQIDLIARQFDRHCRDVED